MHDTTSSFRFSPRLVFGLILIAVGVLLTLDQVGWLEWDTVAPYLLPALLGFVGLVKLLPPTTPGGRLAGSLLVLAGVWLLLYQLGLLRWLSFWKLWPLLLVVAGGWIAWRAVTGQRTLGFVRFEQRDPSASGSQGLPGTVSGMAILGGVKRGSNAADFRGGDLFALLGACEIDLRQARITHSPAVIEAFALWGGVEIRVPEDWSVRLEGLPLLGGYEDNTSPPKVSTGQELIIKGIAIMGGVEVKN